MYIHIFARSIQTLNINIMKKTTLVFIAIAFMGTVLTGFINKKTDAPEWKIDPVHSSVTFMATHLGTPFVGNFGKFDGVLKFDPADLTNSSATFTIDVNSINTNIEKRDGHLKSAEFFDAEKYPAMTFKSEKIIKKIPGNDKEFIVMGSLTAKDVTKKIEVPLTITANGPHPFNKEMLMLGMKTAFKIVRSEYHIGSGDWASTAVVGDDVAVSVFAEFSRRK